MSVLVTGASGAIGRAVVDRLLGEGHSVVGLDRWTPPRPLPPRAAFTFQQCDIRDRESLGRVTNAHEIGEIIHLAAVLPDEAERDPKAALDINASVVVDICNLALEHSIRRVVFASSKGVYARVDGRHGHPRYEPVDETFPIGPEGIYDITKYAGERIGTFFADARGLDFVALRFAATYGPGRSARHGSFAVRSAIVESAFRGIPFTLPTGRDQRDDFVYTGDVAQALVRAAAAGNVEHRVFNIGSGVGSSLEDVAEILRDTLPQADIDIGPGLDYGTGTGRYCVFDISRARRELGYEPEYPLGRGIRDYLRVLGEAPPVQVDQEIQGTVDDLAGGGIPDRC